MWCMSALASKFPCLFLFMHLPPPSSPLLPFPIPGSKAQPCSLTGKHFAFKNLPSEKHLKGVAAPSSDLLLSSIPECTWILAMETTPVCARHQTATLGQMKGALGICQSKPLIDTRTHAAARFNPKLVLREGAGLLSL